MEAQQIPWGGFHHIALITRDLDATIHFYGDVLGMEVGAVTDRRGKHVFIRPGGETWGMHFFEHPDGEIFTDPGLLRERFIFLPGAMQHMAFTLPDEDAALALRGCLEAHGIEMTPINTIGPVRNFLFVDNNGILLEAAWSA